MKNLEQRLSAGALEEDGVGGMSEVPKGWADGTTVEDVAEIRSGNGFPKKYQGRTEGELPFFKVGDISRNWQKGQITLAKADHYLTRAESKEIRAKTLPEGSVVFAKIGAAVALNRRAILGTEAFVDNNVMGLVPSDATTSRFLFYFMCQVDLGAATRGGAVPSLRKGDVGTLDLPLPPLPEQRRIVARIEKLFSRLDAGVAALHHAKAQLKRYRQSVLAAAVTGQLTQAWRERTQGGDTQENSSDLFGTPLPKSWYCSPLENVVTEGPRNGYSPKCGTNTNGSKVLKLSATSSGRMVLNEKTTKISLLPVDPKSHAWLQPNDVLIQRANSLELLGSTGIYEGPKDQYVYPDLMMRVRLVEPTTRKLLVLYLNSLPARNYFQRNATGVAGNMPKINGTTVKALPIPFPPIAEQHQIVAEVEARTTAIDHLEVDLDRQITRSNRLRQSTLASAFKGVL